tara:strand:- start:645 stop:1832 length:1188 start_codon:yes stop_codon:yes gene_type:complete
MGPGISGTLPTVQVVNPLFQNPDPIIDTDPFLSDAEKFNPIPAMPPAGGILTGGAQVPLYVGGGSLLGGGALALSNQNAQANMPMPNNTTVTRTGKGPVGMETPPVTPTQTAVAAAPDPVTAEAKEVVDDIKALNVDPDVIGAEDTKPKGKTGIDGVLDKIFNMQKNNPEAYQDFLRGAYFYEAGQRGESITEAMLGYSKFNNEQQKALLDTTLKYIDIQAKTANIGRDEVKFNLEILNKESQIQNRISQIEERSRKANEDAASYPEGITVADVKSRIENKIEADFFAGLKDKPTENINSLVDQLEPIVKVNLLSGLDINTSVANAVQLALDSGAITPSYNKPGVLYGSTPVAGSVDASMFGQAQRVTVTTQEQYDQLPSGTRYIDKDGIPGIKP